MTAEILNFLKSVLSAPAFHFLLGFAGGLGLGLWLGFRFSPGRYAYLTSCLDAQGAERKERREERERDERRAAEQLAAETAERERLFPVSGVLWNRDGEPFCPACRTPLPGFLVTDQHSLPYSVCPGCGRRIVLNTPHGKDLPAIRAEVAEAIGSR